MSNKELTITADKIVEAANKYPRSADILKTMFPDAFKKDILDCSRGNKFKHPLNGSIVTIIDVSLLLVKYNAYNDGNNSWALLRQDSVVMDEPKSTSLHNLGQWLADNNYIKV